MLHGTADAQIPIQEVSSYEAKLRTLGKVFEFKYVTGFRTCCPLQAEGELPVHVEVLTSFLKRILAAPAVVAPPASPPRHRRASPQAVTCRGRGV